MFTMMRKKKGYFLIDALEVMKAWVATLKLDLPRLHSAPVPGGVVSEVVSRLRSGLADDNLEATLETLRDSSALASLAATNLVGTKTGRYIQAATELSEYMAEVASSGGAALYKSADPILAATLFAANSTAPTTWMLTSDVKLPQLLRDRYDSVVHSFTLETKKGKAEVSGSSQLESELNDLRTASSSFGRLMQYYVVANLILDPVQITHLLPMSSAVATAAGQQKRKLSLSAMAGFWHATLRLPAMCNLYMYRMAFKTLDALFGPFPTWSVMTTAESLIANEVEPYDIFNVKGQISVIDHWLVDPANPDVRGVIRDYLTPEFAAGLDGISETIRNEELPAIEGVNGAWAPTTVVGVSNLDSMASDGALQRMTPYLRAVLVDAPVANMTPLTEAGAIVNIISAVASNLMAHAYSATFGNRLYLLPEASRELARTVKGINIPSPLRRIFTHELGIQNSRQMGKSATITIGGIFDSAHYRMSSALNLGGAFGESGKINRIARSWQIGSTFFDDVQREFLVSNLTDSSLGMYMPTYLSEGDGLFTPEALKDVKQLFSMLIAATGTDIPYMLELLEAPVSAKMLVTSLSSIGIITANDDVVVGYGYPYGCTYEELAIYFTAFKTKYEGVALDEGKKYKFYPLERMPIIPADARHTSSRILPYGPIFGFYLANLNLGYDEESMSFAAVSNSKNKLAGIPIPAFAQGKPYAHFFMQPQMDDPTFASVLFTRLVAHRAAGVMMFGAGAYRSSEPTALGLKQRTWAGSETTIGLRYLTYDPIIIAGADVSEITPDQTSKELMELVKTVEAEVAAESAREASKVEESPRILKEAETAVEDVAAAEVGTTKAEQSADLKPSKKKKSTGEVKEDDDESTK